MLVISMLRIGKKANFNRLGGFCLGRWICYVKLCSKKTLIDRPVHRRIIDELENSSDRLTQLLGKDLREIPYIIFLFHHFSMCLSKKQFWTSSQRKTNLSKRWKTRHARGDKQTWDNYKQEFCHPSKKLRRKIETYIKLGFYNNSWEFASNI